MKKARLIRHAIIAVVLLSGLIWSMAEAQQEMKGASFPEGGFLVTGQWLREHQGDDNLVIVDVRSEKDVQQDGGTYIADAIQLPWSTFRFSDTAYGIGDRFVGMEEARKILGSAGIAGNSTVVLYDSVKNDGGATASYLFWILDLLGHKKMHLLEQGIDGWIAAEGAVASQPRKAEPVLYQVPAATARVDRLASEQFIYNRLGDSLYTILDVRSREEYLGQKPNMGLTGSVLKLGHIPTAVNVDYRLNWADSESKAVKSYPELQELYRGFDPSLPVIVYCHSGRRSSFTYFILRLMGFEKVILYDNSWNGWGRHQAYFPVETSENKVSGTFLPGAGGKASRREQQQVNLSRQDTRELQAPAGGYVSCGG